MAYPRWRYFPSHTQHPPWVEEVVAAFRKSRHLIDSELETKKSDAVLAAIAPHLRQSGFTVEGAGGALGRIARPVLFGEGGVARTTYSVDAFHPEHGVLVEVEAGRGWMGNAVYRDLVRTSQIVDARFLALAVRQTYAYQSSGRRTVNEDYRLTVDLVESIYAGGRLTLPFEGLLVVGY